MEVEEKEAGGRGWGKWAFYQGVKHIRSRTCNNEVTVEMCHLSAASDAVTAVAWAPQADRGGAWLLTLGVSCNRVVTPSLRHILEGPQARCDRAEVVENETWFAIQQQRHLVVEGSRA